jgi:hypothetical protein
MIVTAEMLIGTWQLESWSLVYQDGRPEEFPLGPDAQGLILYTPDGHVSATLMRAVRPGAAPSDATSKAAAYDESFAYAGRYAIRDNTVFHTLAIATNPAIIGVTSTRHIQLDGDQLVLSGPDFHAGSPRTQRIAWRRAKANTA